MGERYLVEMKNISKNFGALQALQNVDFKIKKAEIVGLIGDNAAGKSTLMKILSGALKPNNGEIFFEGKKVDLKTPKDSMKLGIEMVYQDLAVFENLDVKSNIFIGREAVHGLGRFIQFFLNERAMEKKSIEILKKLGINIISMRLPVKNLSGGQRQGIAIGRVILFNAKLVIMDEPTSAMAVKEVQKILDLVLALKKQGISVIIISHRIEDVFKVGDRVVVLKGGKRIGERIIKDTTMEEVIGLIIGSKESIRG